MDFRACNVIYVYRAANRDELVRQSSNPSATAPNETSKSSIKEQRHEILEHNLEKLLQLFSEVYICSTGRSCVTKLFDLNRGSSVDLVPTVVLIDIPKEDQPQNKSWNESRPCTPSSLATDQEDHQNESLHDDSNIEDIYGLELLRQIVSDIEYRNLSNLTVPVAIIEAPNIPLRNTRSKISIPLQPDYHKNVPGISSASAEKAQRSISVSYIDQTQLMKSLDTGAVDVLTSPLSEARLSSLVIHAYRAHHNALKEHRALVERRRNRKGSWLGVNNQKPYAYLREAMVSGLMDSICQIGDHNPLPNSLTVSIVPNRRETISAVLDSWDFSAHDFTDDELLYAALQMLQHILKMPELELWHLSTENLTVFLFASRSAYNAFVPYHNFRHVVDVLQACFVFLIRLGRIPPYSDSYSVFSSSPSSDLAESIRPNDALALLITAIGHDVGHPGVNNAFLTSLNAPLTQLYNDRSVLETFHCAAYSQILRRYWPAAFRSAEMRQLMINSILATDMGLHFDYMKRLAGFQQDIRSCDSTIMSKTWSGGERRVLACSLLIKCADISNVARKYDTASKWTINLTDECARQASMEKDLGIPSVLVAPPVREITQLGKSQIGFMETFALPLFQEVTNIMPAMSFCVRELQKNKSIWEDKIVEHRNIKKDEKIAGNDASSHLETINAEKSNVKNSENLTIPTRYGKKKRPNLKPIDVSLSVANFQNLTPFSKVSNTNSSNISSSRRLSSPKSPLSNDGTGKKFFNFEEYETPILAGIENIDTSFEDSEGHNSISLQSERIPLRKMSLNTIGSEKERLSNGTEISSSIADDWTSQATLENQPRSPSTEGTSVTSDSENSDEFVQSHLLHQELSIILDRDTEKETDPFYDNIGTTEETDTYVKNLVVVQKVRVLKKKPSRFRLKFWKRNKRNSSSTSVLHNSKVYNKVEKM
ncbi:putative 3 5 -cyclic nucleotide phosphodiesterase [Golovinomyces cichoracearum]|uniref:Phosphodiesterase n=1 Tax=Golovinomyces cichoracearum TaxID=62708 RepID=A0A420H919_9PEZI|nr:putative 3 5 -cyclic nucleotide phosphodiesterase [Golovinomyces cichoracearum]